MNTQQQDTKEYFNLAGLIQNYRRYWYIFAVCVVGCVVLGWLVSRVKAPQYEVKATLLISQDDNEGALGDFAALFGGGNSVEDEQFSVGSHTIMREVAKKLGTNVSYVTKTGFLKKELNYTDEPVSLSYDKALADTLTKYIVFKVEASVNGKVDVKAKLNRETIGKVKNANFPVKLDTPYGEFIFNKTEDFPANEDVTTTITLTGYDNAAEDLSKDIDVEVASRKANVITLETVTPNVDLGKAVLDEILEIYNERNLLVRNERNLKTLEFIDSRLALLGDDLSDSEATIQEFKTKNNITDLEAEASYQLQRRGQLDRQLVEVETELQVINLIRDFLSNPANANELVPVTYSAVDGVISSYNQLVLKRMDLVRNATTNNVMLQNLDNKIDALRANILQSISKNRETTQVRLNDLKREMNVTSGHLGDIPQFERSYRDIKRQQGIKESLYTYLLKQREQTEMLLSNTQLRGVIIDQAYAVNEPVGLSRTMILAVSFILGLMLAVFILYLKNLFKTNFETQDEVKDIVKLPILGEVSFNRTGETVVVRDRVTSSAAELFRLLRSNLQFLLRKPGCKVVLVTSTSSGEGKSYISINVATSIAMLGKRVLLMGMDIRRPRLAEYLGLSNDKGFTTYIADSSVKLSSIIQKDAIIQGLDIITAGPVPPNPAELLADERVDHLFEDLRQQYDYIIIDSAPVGMVSDTFAIDRLADATVYVCRAKHTPLKDLQFINELAQQKRLSNMSVVVNGTKSFKTYGYGEANNHQKK